MQKEKVVSSQQSIDIPPIVETPIYQQPDFGRKVTNWLLIGLVVLLFGTTGLFAYKYFQLKQQLDKQQAAPSISPTGIVTTSPSPGIDPTVNWKKVKIMDLNVDPETKIGTSVKGLEIKYPQDWFYLSGDNLGGTGAGDFIMSFQSNKILDDVPKEEIQIEIFLFSLPKEGLHEFVSNYQKTGLKKPTEITVNNFNGYRGETDKEIKYFLKIDENNVAHIYVTPKDSDKIDVFNQILSTLKFTN